MPEHHPYDHTVTSWGWVLIAIALAMIVGLFLHVIVDHSREARTASVSASAGTTAVMPTHAATPWLESFGRMVG